MTTTPPLQPGERLHRYEVVRVIGGGGSSFVYEVRHTYTGKTLALKIGAQAHPTGGRVLERARREAELVAGIRHRNIVTLHDAGCTHDGRAWQVMDLLEGRPLDVLLRTHAGPLPVAQALRYAADVSDGLAEAHERGVVHRDVKPANIFITSHNEAVLLDFGVARFQGAGFTSVEGVRAPGTLVYMSLEHLMGTPLDGRTDIYSLGLVLYEMIAGSHPFYDGGVVPSEIYFAEARLQRDPRPLTEVVPGLPEPFWSLVDRAIRKDRDERYATARELGWAVRDLLRQLTEDPGLLKNLEHPPRSLNLKAMRRDYVAPHPLPSFHTDPSADAPSVIAEGAVPAPVPLSDTTETTELTVRRADAEAAHADREVPPVVAAVRPTLRHSSRTTIARAAVLGASIGVSAALVWGLLYFGCLRP